MKTKTRKRMIYACASVALVLVECGIALYVHDDFIRPYVGDVLVVVLIYCICRVAVPDRVALLPVWVFAFACLTELAQYINIVELLGLQDNATLSIMVGSVFEWADVACYAVGCAAAGVVEILMNRSE